MAIFTTDLIINGKKYKNLMVSGSSDDINSITTAHLTNAQAKKLLGDAYSKNFYQVDLQNHLWEIPQTGKNRSKYVGELNPTTSYLLANGGKIIKLKNDFVINITLTMLKKMGIYDSKNSILNGASINAALKRKITNQTLFYTIGTDTLKYTVDEVAEALQSKIERNEKFNMSNETPYSKAIDFLRESKPTIIDPNDRQRAQELINSYNESIKKSVASTDSNFKSFEVGKSYYGQFMSESDYFDNKLIIKVLKRTKTMLTYLYNNKEQKSKIYNTQLYEYVFPTGRYSMAPMVTSEREYQPEASETINSLNRDLFKSKKQEIITKYDDTTDKIKLNLAYINREFNEAIKSFGAKWDGSSWLVPITRKVQLEKELFDHYGINSSKMALADVEFHSNDPLTAVAGDDVELFGRTVIHAMGRDSKPKLGYGVSATELHGGGSIKNYTGSAVIHEMYDVPLHRADEYEDSTVKIEYVYP